MLLWSTSIAGARERIHAAAGAAALLVTSIHMTLLGALLSLSQPPVRGGQVTCFGLVLSDTQDQQIGGVIMLLVGAAVYLAGGVWLVGTLLAPQPQSQR